MATLPNGLPFVFMCDRASYLLTEKQVVTGLATLQSAVQDLSRAYIAHTNTVLGQAPGSSLSYPAFALNLGDVILGGRGITPGPGGSDQAQPKRKRKKTKDPNAPKRPLTAYFLYMQHARPLIGKDLGDKATPGEVSREGTRRWNAMDEPEKAMWQKYYAKNRLEYQNKVTEYKAHKDDGNVSDEAAAQLAAENGAITDGHDDSNAASDIESITSARAAKSATGRVTKRRRTPKEVADVKAAAISAAPLNIKQTAIRPPTATDDEGEGESEAEREKERLKKERKPSRSSKRSRESLSERLVAESPASRRPRSPAGGKEKEKKEKPLRKKRKSEVSGEA
ncbi:MAG: hypothetical protein M1829_006391 [Trizodia sp. TS-e1964]|nr:MAG: hypothetical protein M1829_006391 [Trizodia sp. TS-e1964]